jgi:hypothetical protein
VVAAVVVMMAGSGEGQACQINHFSCRNPWRFRFRLRQLLSGNAANDYQEKSGEGVPQERWILSNLE